MKKIYFLLITFFVCHNLLATGTTPPDGVPCPSAGTSINITICDDNLATINLFGLIIAANPGGTWMRMSGNGGIFDAAAGTFIPTPGATSSSFMYTITGTPPCPSDSSVATITINQKPTAGILTGNQNICVGFTTSFLSTNPGGAWSSSNPAVATVSPVSGVVTGNSAGNATITYTIPGTVPCPNATATRIVTVNAPPNPGVLSGNQNLCVGESATYTSTTLGGSWTSSNTLVATVSASGLVTAMSNGTVTISYTVLGSGGCVNAVVTRTVTVSGPTIISSGVEAQTVCLNTSIIPMVYTLDNGASGVTITAGALPPGVTTSFNSLSGTYTIAGTPSEAGIFSFVLSTSGGCGVAILSGSITVKVYSEVILISAPDTANQEICLGELIIPISYEVTNGLPISLFLPLGLDYTHVNNILTITGTPLMSLPTDQTYSIGVGGGQCAQSSGSISVLPSVTLTLNSTPSTLNQTVCINTPIEPIVFSALSGATEAIAAGLPPGVSAIFSSGILTITGTPTIVGTFGFTVTTAGGCGISSLSGTITVSDHVMASVFCDPTQVTTSPVTSVFFDWNNFVSSPSFQYSYSINNGPLQSGSTNLSHYEVLGVSPGQTVQFFLTNAFGVNCFLPTSASCTLLADADFDADTFNYYPNPVNDIVTLSNTNPITNIEIINTVGQQVFNKTADSKSVEVDMSGFTHGIYIARLTSGTTTKTIKIVKN